MSANSPSAVPEAGSPVAEPTASSTPTLAVPTASSFVPKTPKMGGLVQTGSTDYCAWTGGKPKPDWSGLDSSAATEPLDAFQFRPSSPGSAQKSMKYREQGFETKFTMKSNLQVFIQEIQEYLARAGLDTISYLVDPANPSEMWTITPSLISPLPSQLPSLCARSTSTSTTRQMTTLLAGGSWIAWIPSWQRRSRTGLTPMRDSSLTGSPSSTASSLARMPSRQPQA